MTDVILVATDRRMHPGAERIPVAPRPANALLTFSTTLNSLTSDEVDEVVALSRQVGTPAVLAVGEGGRLRLLSADPGDRVFESAFDGRRRRRARAAGRILVAESVDGWIEAAVEHRPALREWADEYLRARSAQLEAGERVVVVHHRDLLAWRP